MPVARMCSVALAVAVASLAAAATTGAGDAARPADASGTDAAAGPLQDVSQAVSGSAGVAAANASDPLWGPFVQFVADFDKNYTKGEVESRFAAFKESFLFVEACNVQNNTFTCGLNEHSDVTHQEFVKTYLGGLDPSLDDEGDGEVEVGAPFPDTEEVPKAGSGNSAPAAIDWVKKGVVTPVLNQGDRCGSCWAFAATAAISSAWAIKTGSLVLLSQQQLLDCSSGSCKGGLATRAFRYARGSPLCTAASYPYTGVEKKCASRCYQALARGRVAGFRNVARHSELALMRAVAGQPAAVSIDANEPEFKHYQRGIISRACGTSVNHAVLLVGYSYSGGYWLLKNSWGAKWGEKGYVRIAQGKGPTGSGECGILTRPAFPVVHAAEAATEPSSSNTTQPGPRRLGQDVEQPTIFA